MQFSQRQHAHFAVFAAALSSPARPWPASAMSGSAITKATAAIAHRRENVFMFKTPDLKPNRSNPTRRLRLSGAVRHSPPKSLIGGGTGGRSVRLAGLRELGSRRTAAGHSTTTPSRSGTRAARGTGTGPDISQGQTGAHGHPHAAPSSSEGFPSPHVQVDGISMGRDTSAATAATMSRERTMHTPRMDHHLLRYSFTG